MLLPLFKRLVFSAAFVSSSLLFSSSVLADYITMKNGSYLVGKIISKKDETLILDTPYAGELIISWGEILEIKTHNPIEVHTTDGELIKTEHIVDDNDPTIVFAEDSGYSEDDPKYVVDAGYLDSDDVSILKPEPWEIGIGAKFTGRVDFGLQIENGNTDKTSLMTSTALAWERVDDRWSVDARYDKEESDGDVTKDQWELIGDYDYFFNEDWYTGAYGRAEQDNIAELDHRVILGPLLGHQFWRGDDSNLSSEVGAVYVFEKFKGDDQTTYPGLRWNLSYDRFTYQDIIQLYYENELQVDAGDIGNGDRKLFTAKIGARVFLIENLSASAEYRYDYDGSATGDVEKEDTATIISLGYSW